MKFYAVITLSQVRNEKRKLPEIRYNSVLGMPKIYQWIKRKDNSDQRSGNQGGMSDFFFWDDCGGMNEKP